MPGGTADSQVSGQSGEGATSPVRRAHPETESPLSAPPADHEWVELSSATELPDVLGEIVVAEAADDLLPAAEYAAQNG